MIDALPLLLKDLQRLSFANDTRQDKTIQHILTQQYTSNKLKFQMEISDTDTQMVGRCSIGVGSRITTDLCWREKLSMASFADIPINCYDDI